MSKRIALLPGDGIGPEIMDAAVAVLKTISHKFGHEFEFVTADLGGVAIDRHGVPLPDETLDVCRASDAILLASVGGPKWDHLPKEKRAETGLLKLRKELDLYANVRPVKAYEALLSSSPLKDERVRGTDFVIVRELSSGIYFGQPSERRIIDGENGVVDTLLYKESEIERVVRYAFELAKTRRKKVTSIDKANVLESSRVWREITERIAKEYPDVALEHMLVDNGAMQLVMNPKQFDVVVTENMFGDILSDEGSVLTGSIGLLPSSSIASTGLHLYEPIHGSAPTLAGQNVANPIAMILSVAMMLETSFGYVKEGEVIRKAVQNVIEAGLKTSDLAQEQDAKHVTTTEMTKQIIEQILGDFTIKDIMEIYA